jgi:hypothetical protein
LNLFTAQLYLGREKRIWRRFSATPSGTIAHKNKKRIRVVLTPASAAHPLRIRCASAAHPLRIRCASAAHPLRIRCAAGTQAARWL